MNYKFIGLVIIYSVFAVSMFTKPSSAYFSDVASSTTNTFTTAESFGEEEATPSASIFINEFLPNPSGSETTEWIELYNASDQIVNIGGWQLDDIQNDGSEPYLIPVDTMINANSYLVFERTDTGIILNNTNESVRLLDQSDVVIDLHEYLSTTEDATIGRENDGLEPWKTCSVVTKNSSNNGSC